MDKNRYKKQEISNTIGINIIQLKKYKDRFSKDNKGKTVLIGKSVTEYLTGPDRVMFCIFLESKTKRAIKETVIPLPHKFDNFHIRINTNKN